MRRNRLLNSRPFDRIAEHPHVVIRQQLRGPLIVVLCEKLHGIQPQLSRRLATLLTTLTLPDDITLAVDIDPVNLA